MAMSDVELPQAWPRVPREFTIRRDQRGLWIASETHGLLGGVFRCKDAFRFALREADGETTRVRIEPSTETFRH